jgi:hypothetical protein
LLDKLKSAVPACRPADVDVASPDAYEGVGTDWAAAAFDVTVVSCYTEKRERSPLLLVSARAAGHAATLARAVRYPPFSTERRTYKGCSG